MHSLIDINQILILKTELSLESVRNGDSSKCIPALAEIRETLNVNAALLHDARKKFQELKF